MKTKLDLRIKVPNEDFEDLMIDEMESGSITPTTLDERAFLNHKKLRLSLHKSLIEKDTKVTENFRKNWEFS